MAGYIGRIEPLDAGHARPHVRLLLLCSQLRLNGAKLRAQGCCKGESFRESADAGSDADDIVRHVSQPSGMQVKQPWRRRQGGKSVAQLVGRHRADIAEILRQNNRRSAGEKGRFIEFI
jgi:hypothetical protein